VKLTVGILAGKIFKKLRMSSFSKEVVKIFLGNTLLKL
jgi:hypothetical protein